MLHQLHQLLTCQFFCKALWFYYQLLEHPDFGGLTKLGMLIRGALNKKLAEGLRFTTEVNKWLTKHYYDYPESPEGFEKWQTLLHDKLRESNTKLEAHYS